MAAVNREPSGAWTSDPGPLRCPRCHGGLRRIDAGFECDADGCRASLPIRDGVLVVREILTEDNKIGKQWQLCRIRSSGPPTPEAIGSGRMG